MCGGSATAAHAINATGRLGPTANRAGHIFSGFNLNHVGHKVARGWVGCQYSYWWANSI
jgi:hypothetical protein